METEQVHKRKSINLQTLFINIKYLLKGKVLIANVLPVFTAFWLALHFTHQSFYDHLGTFFMTMVSSTLVISGALMFNNWFEHDLDTQMDRTKKRPTVTGDFSLRNVLIAAIITTIIGLIIIFLVNIEAGIYSFLGWFFYVVLYTFWSKRRYTINTIIGSISGAFTPLIGWAVITPANHLVPLMLFYILLIWQVPHTISIAIKRLDDYTRACIPMLPVVIGTKASIRQNLYYVLALLPVPIMLFESLGIIFSIVSALLTLGWVVLSVRGYTTHNKHRWAEMNLRYSLIYLIVSFMLMIVLTI